MLEPRVASYYVQAGMFATETLREASDMIAFLTTTDPIKLSAVQALLEGAAIESTVFDRAAGTLWTSIIPLRLMIAAEDEAQAKRVLTAARWCAAGDGEWDFVELGGARSDGTLA